MQRPTSSVHRIHFADFSGSEFERLVFAYHWRCGEWRSLEWYGQAGSDLGRDIWGVRGGGQTVCIQCINRKNLTFAKVSADIAKVLKAPHGVPTCFRVVAQSSISAKTRDKIKTHINSLGVHECDIWSGAEFEEFLRKEAESLLKRFVGGEPFPDAAEDLRNLAATSQVVNDKDALALFAKLFDRPAFYTPIHQESNLADFKQAITDTIQALGTGIWKARDGNLIDRIPSRHQLESETLRTQLEAVEKALSRLRARYDEMIRSGVLRRCQCDDPSCSVFFFEPPQAAQELEQARDEVLVSFRQVYPEFKQLPW